MSIFSGIEIVFFFLGAVTTLGVGAIIWVKKTRNVHATELLLMSVGLFLFVFALAWSLSSVLEGEPQAANMGILFFGLPSIILFGTVAKMLSKSQTLKS